MKKSVFFLLFLGIALLSSRFPFSNEDQPAQAVRVSPALQKASGPYFTTDHQNRPVLSWIGQTGPESYRLFYALSKDGGQTFGKPQSVPTSVGVYPHDENLSKLIWKKNGDMLAVFAVSNPNEQNAYAGLLYYTQSFDGGKTWTPRRQLSPAKASSIDERYFDLSRLPDGEIGAVWLDSRKSVPSHHGAHHSHEGSSLYFSRTEGRNGFVKEKSLAGSVCQCCRTRLYKDDNNQLHLTYRAILNDSIRDMMHMVSTDQGQTFSEPKRISFDNWIIRGCPHTGPTMVADQQGLHFAWYTLGNGAGVFYCQSKDGGKTFTERENVSGQASAKHPQLAALKDGKLALLWDERSEKEDQTNFRVGMQIRAANGQILRREFITPNAVSASYPVVLAMPTHLLVAYTQKAGGQEEVYFQRVVLGPP